MDLNKFSAVWCILVKMIFCNALEPLGQSYQTADFRRNGSNTPQSGIWQGNMSETSKPPSHSDLSKLLIPSLFPNVPPYIKFALPNDPANMLPPEVKESLIWKYSKLTAQITLKILTNTGFYFKRDSKNWLGLYGSSFRREGAVKPYQKLNEIPGRIALEFKTSMWKNIQRLQEQHGKEELDFVPETYILPFELSKFREAWEKTENKLWIQKIAGGSRSRGLRLISHWNQVNENVATSRVIQKYIQNPYLIDGVKTQVRVFAMATSFIPLRLFVQREIFLKFGVANYSESLDTIKDLCIHSTDFGRDYPNKCQEHVMGEHGKLKPDIISRSGNENYIRALMQEKNLDFENFRNQLEDMIIKTVIAAEHPIATKSGAGSLSRYNAYQFWAIDFALDENFRPYLLELNSLPTMRSGAKGVPREGVADIKSKAVSGLFTIAGFHLPPTLSQEAKRLVVEELNLKTENPSLMPEMYTYQVSEAGKQKQNYFNSIGINSRSKYLEEILMNLTPDDVRQLVIAEDERNRALLYKRVFPSAQMYKYMKYVQSKPYYYMLLDAWETKYGDNRSAGIARLAELTSVNRHLEP